MTYTDLVGAVARPLKARLPGSCYFNHMIWRAWHLVAGNACCAVAALCPDFGVRRWAPLRERRWASASRRWIAQVLLMAGLVAVGGNALAQTPGVLDWSAQGFVDEAATPRNFTVASGGINANVTWRTITDGGSFIPAGGADYISYEAGTASGFTGFLNLGFDNDREDQDDQIILDIAFSRGVTNLQFTLTDIDEGNFDDFIEVHYVTTGGLINARTGNFGFPQGNAVGIDDENFADGWEGLAIAAGNQTIGNVAFNFGALEVRAIQIRYYSGNDVQGNADPGLQLAGLSDVTYVVPEPVSDLSIVKTVSNPAPAIGATIAYTLTLSNAGPDPATGVQVRDILPAGLAFVSDNGGGTYNSATGLWTPAAIASGGSVSLVINASVTGAGTITNTGEIIADTGRDPDSTPGNGAAGEDDIAAVTINAGGGGGTPPTIACGASADRLDWNANPWPSNSLAQSYSVAGQAFDFAFTGDTGFFVDVGSGLTPITSAQLTGGNAATENSLLAAVNWPASTSSITFSASVGVPGIGVDALQFAIYDVDIGAGNVFIDQLQISGSFDGASVIPVLTAGGANTVSGQVATGTGEAPSTSAAGTVFVTFNAPVDRVTITYGNGPGVVADPATQGVGFADFLFCQPVPAMLDATKTVAVLGGGFAIPGADVIYTITAVNTGNGIVDADTVFLVDSLPADITFFNGDIDDAGPETGPILFEQTGAGLTFTPASDIAYSTDATRPADFSACGYTPIAGYDPNVRHICINPKGAFQAGDPDPSFSVSFRARIR